ncbi:carbohydrate ABC transporter permease [Spongiactinospora gelatinilytica]|uniref:carbohydrate ABC transporter permease n=1 Tax=Spongiactinospora gelatinilytica TaxID=2666298 RepID=UPI0018F5EAEA|nr:sugar ABC transporter permease [Spongiactinospora gelatinilytica]
MRPHKPLTPYLFAAPALLVFAFAVLAPVLATGAFSLTEWSGFGPMTFTGLGNYVRALGDDVFVGSFLHVTLYIVVTIVLEVAFGLVLAGVLAARRGGSPWFRVALFTPVMLPMVVVAVLWSFVYNGDFGLVNASLSAIGLDGLTRVWLGDPATALLAVCVVSGWVYAGFYMAIFYAALTQIPPEVIEAARLDGAGEARIFARVKVPMIRNAVEVCLLLCVTGGFQTFDLFYVLTGGGPYNATEIPTTYLTRVVFRDGEVGYGSAMAVLMTAVVVLVGIVFMRLRRGRGAEA